MHPAEGIRLRDALAQCERLTPVAHRRLVLGGHRIAVNVHSTAIAARVLPALELHAAAVDAHTGPELTLHVLAPDQLPAPQPEFTDDDRTPDAVAHRFRFADDTFFALARSDTRSITLVDRERRAALYCAPHDALPDYEQAAPLRDLLDAWFGWHGGHVLHGAAVGTERGAVLLAGRGGSGKSTASLSALAAGMDFLGDDYVLVTAAPDGTPQVHGLFASAKISAGELPLFASVASRAERLLPATSHKAMLRLGPEFRRQWRASSPVRAVVIPRVSGVPASRLAPLSAPRALLALAPSSILQSAAGGARALEFMKQLLASVPAFVLESGTDRAGIARCIADWLSATEPRGSRNGNGTENHAGQ